MKKLWPWVALGMAILLTALLLTRATGGAAASTVGRGALGWRGFALLLEGHGADLLVLDRPLEHRDSILGEQGGTGRGRRPRSTLVVGFPWQRGDLGWNPAPVLGFVRRGGRLVVATSGSSVPSWPETRLLEALDLERVDRQRSGPLRPIRWWRERRSGDRWPASRDAPWSEPLVTGSLAAVTRPPADGRATTLATDETEEPIASVFEVGDGEVWLLPSQVLANAYLGESGNAALALALVASLDGPVVIDEYHHGLLSAEAGLAEPAGRAFDAVAIQLGLLWVLAVIAFAWRFGPSWPTAATQDDAHRSFLVGLGALHHRLGHEQEASEQLVRRVSAYDPSLVPPRELEDRLERADSVPFERLARELSRRPAPPQSTPPRLGARR